MDTRRLPEKRGEERIEENQWVGEKVSQSVFGCCDNLKGTLQIGRLEKNPLPLMLLGRDVQVSVVDTVRDVGQCEKKLTFLALRSS